MYFEVKSTLFVFSNVLEFGQKLDQFLKKNNLPSLPNEQNDGALIPRYYFLHLLHLRNLTLTLHQLLDLKTDELEQASFLTLFVFSSSSGISSIKSGQM